VIRADLDWTSGWMAHDETIEDWLARVHPTQYAYDDLRTLRWTPADLEAPEGRLPDGRVITDRYNRCMTCEEWSPCTVREHITRLVAASSAGQLDLTLGSGAARYEPRRKI
jgi:hypothetical protein